MSTPELKERAAQHAVAAELKSGMCVGLGSGSTAACAVNALGKALQDGTLQAIIGVPTSEATARQAVALGIPLRELHEVEGLDVTIDGADEVDPALNLIKGLGGALTREKMVAQATTGRYVVVADESKVVTGLGQHAPLPVEVLPFGWRFQAQRLARFGAVPRLRMADGAPFLTDNGNHILDCTFPDGIDDPQLLEWLLIALAGIVEHGLFLDIATVAYIATPDGVQRLGDGPGLE